MSRKRPKRSNDPATTRRFRLEWPRKNRTALRAYNNHVERDGVFSEGLRSF